MSKLKIVGNAACPSCKASGGDRTGNHLLIFQNQEGESFAKCTRSHCGLYVSPAEFDPDRFKPVPIKNKSPEKAAIELKEISECPIVSLDTRKIKDHVAVLSLLS